jgi:lycopene elongase/hydratase (dihydrobisanhydrobacterioruberin-forming)
MKLDLKTLVVISRPRFWLYLVGPFILGYALGAREHTQFLSAQFWLYLGYFLFPANLFLYGVNDLADTDTDQFNAKKNGYEHGLKIAQHRPLQRVTVGCVIVTCLAAFFTSNVVSASLLFLFLLLSFAYSCPPFRWKASPFIDSASNILYILPGIFAYHLMTGILPPFYIVITLGFWTAAMHLFSAVPDIEADKLAGLRTTAVVLGEQKSLMLCSVLWFLCLGGIYRVTSAPAVLLLGIYGVLPLLSLSRKWPAEKIYRIFPLLNAAVGFIVFWIVVTQRLL